MKLYQVDAFSNKIFGGNPAGVCITEQYLSDDLMQNIATEMNLSETAFACKDNAVWNIRYFTPKAEIALCGHATLATAHCLFDDGLVSPTETIQFKAPGGELSVKQDNGWLIMNFPEFTITEAKSSVEEFKTITNIAASALFSSKDGWTIALMDSEAAVQEAAPRFDAMRESSFNHVVITALSASTEYDYVLRVFAPIYGVNEDPVTGVAECMLAPFWNERTGKTNFLVRQLSKRGGTKRVSYDKPRVIIGGQAIKVFSFTFNQL